jgi:tape measure domain-containing protein
MAFTVDIRGNASHLEKTLKSVKGSIASLGSVAKTGIAGLAGLGAAGAAGLGAFIVTSSQAAASLEDLSIQFEVLTGSAKSSADLLKAFREEEKKSSLNTEDYANAAKNLLGFGMNLEEVVPTLKMLGDVSMGNSERFGSLALAFAQTTAAGRLMGQEVLQFINAGFNPLSQIAKDTGKSMADLKKEMEDGKISVQMVKQAFINATSAGGLFYKAIDKGSAGTTAKINQTEASVTQLQVAFGTGFNEGLKNALDATNTFLPQLTEKFSQSGEFIGAAITDSMAGNSDKFSTLGTAAGELILAGLQASVIAGLDNLGTFLGKGLAYLAENTSLLAFVAPEQAQKVGAGIRDFTSSGTTFREQLDNAMAKPIVTGALEKVNIEAQITRGIKTGIDSTMSEAVKKGILEAWSRQPTGAKFTN